MTQKDLAEKIGVTDKAVSRWETGKGFPDVSLLIDLAYTLGVSVSAVIMGQDVEFESDNVKTNIDNAFIDTLNFKSRICTCKNQLFHEFC